MTARRYPSSLRHPVAQLAALLVLSVWLLAPADGFAQTSSERNDSNLPSWAAPSSSGQPSTYQSSPAEASSAPTTNDVGDGEDPPPAPQVPIPGLEWLALAGGAYGARRLFKKDDASDPEGPDEVA